MSFKKFSMFCYLVLALFPNNGKSMAMKRLIHNDLDAWRKKEFRKPLLLQGARQVGKTYSLLEFGKASFPKVHYVRGR
jgi:hypothetical protein